MNEIMNGILWQFIKLNSVDKYKTTGWSIPTLSHVYKCFNIMDFTFTITLGFFQSALIASILLNTQRLFYIDILCTTTPPSPVGKLKGIQLSWFIVCLR